MPSSPASLHVWKVFRCGGLDQVLIESAADLSALGQLDQKLWVALSCPVRGLELDEKTLALIDTDHDGRIRPPEVVAAVTWAVARLKDPGILTKPGSDLRLDSIQDTTSEGRALLAAANRILARIGKPESPTITVEDTLDPGRIFDAGHLSGDGIVPPGAAKDPQTQALIADIIACEGGTAGRSGIAGVTESRVAAFFSDLTSFVEWSDRGFRADIAVLGEATAAAWTAYFAVRAKVDDYFGRCRLAAFDTRAIAALNREPSEFTSLAGTDLSLDARSAFGFPLSRVEPGRALPLTVGINPAWAAAVDTLRAAVLEPILGKDKLSLTQEDWTAVVGKLAPYEAWLSARPGGPVAQLGLVRARAILASGSRGSLAGLFAEDAKLAPDFMAMSEVERLTRYRRDLGALLRNFVNFSDFYSTAHLAVFQAGLLYLDSRSCHLCLQIEDPEAHAQLATMSRTYLAYLECGRPGGEKMKIAACFTRGDSDYLFVGRNGVFYDRKGRDWDARIIKLVENPISIHQAFWTPYKRVAKFVEDQFERFAVTKDPVAPAVAAAPAAPAAPPSNFDIGKFAGIFAAIGLALGAIGGAVASVATGFLHLQLWQMPLAIAGALLLISGPSMFIAVMKLHQRNLGPVLEANGWAVNGRVKINRALGTSLTDRAALPKFAERSVQDPFANKGADKHLLLLILTILLCLAWLEFATSSHLWPFK